MSAFHQFKPWEEECQPMMKLFLETPMLKIHFNLYLNSWFLVYNLYSDAQREFILSMHHCTNLL